MVVDAIRDQSTIADARLDAVADDALAAFHAAGFDDATALGASLATRCNFANNFARNDLKMIGMSSGLGYLILDTRDRLADSELAAVILVIGALGFALDMVARSLAARLNGGGSAKEGR